MKTMKKVISVLLLVCVLASFATVSAYADSNVPATQDGEVAVQNAANYVASLTLSASTSSGAKATAATAISISAKVGETVTVVPATTTVGTVSNHVSWVASSDLGTANVDGDSDAHTYTLAKSGTFTVTVTTVANGVDDKPLTATCEIYVADAPVKTPATVTIKTPAANTSVVVGGTVQLVAEVSGGSFAGWLVDGPSGCGSFSDQMSRYSSFIAGNTAYSYPIKVYALADDGTRSAPLSITITAIPEIVFATDPVNADKNGIANTNVLSVWVVGRETEQFDWTFTTSPSGANIITSPKAGTVVTGTGISVTAGTGNGSVTITATAKDGTKKSASITIPVNTIGYGDAKVSPTNVTWSRGQGNLTFTVEPVLYSAYIDDVCITGSGNSNKYGYVWSSKNLVIYSNYLSTLSAGEHILTVNTVYADGTNAGTRYAYITINGTASAAYGDNAHVRGTSSNLYFNSNSSISKVYISNQLIDPANYTLSSDGKSVTLKANFLNLLNYGSYTMKLENTSGGTETATFRIVTANYAPATGDESNLAIWVAVMLISGVGAFALIPRRKKEM